MILWFLCGFVMAAGRAEAAAPAAVACDQAAAAAEKLAGKEVRRYWYLRTATLLPIVQEPAVGEGGLIVLGTKDRTVVQALLTDAKLKAAVDGLAAEQYLLKTLAHDGRTVLLIAGGDPIGTLYGAYRFAEHLGVRFYMHGDVVPDQRTALELPVLDETRRPLFDRRGIQPFHDFPEGPDWWNRSTYKAILGQLPKMGMNFFGLHTYPESGVGPEPLVWIGPPDELSPDGKVKASYPARHFTTSNNPPAWGYQSGNTAEFFFGAAELFDRDDYGANYMRGTYPWQKMSPEQCNALFERMGALLSDVFTFAHRLGIKTCIGTETPLIVPAPVKKRLQAAGKNPADPTVVQSIYEGMFQRIAKIHPLDYYWLWTPEGWKYRPFTQQQIDATMADFRAVLAAAKQTQAPFTFATCGWVLGPPQSPALFDQFLPKQMPMSCLSLTGGNTPVEPEFAKVEGRPKWAITWMEDDDRLTVPQLWAARIRRDALDARQYGCTGLIGIHWRTRVLGPNVLALAKAAWDQTGWQGQETAGPDGKMRYSPIADFYADWARSEFGPEAAEPIAAIFTRLDSHLPRPVEWVTGPGSIRPDPAPWHQAQQVYAFVDQLAALRPQVTGLGNLERFDYWVNQFRCLRSIGQVRCVWARFNAALAKAKAEKNPETQKKLARKSVLPVRKELVAAFAELHRYLLATVTNPGEMGNVCNWQQQTLPILLTKPGQELAKLLGEDLPADAMPSKQYLGESRLFVREVRTGIVSGEPFRLTVTVLGGQPAEAAIYWRPLGRGDFSATPLVHVARGVYRVALPAEAVRADFEYYIRATVGDKSLAFPPTAPALAQSVVVEQ
jgi:hypothetical protein